MKRGPPLPVQYIAFGHWILRMRSGSASARMSPVARPSIFFFRRRTRPAALQSSSSSDFDAHLAREAQRRAGGAGRLERCRNRRPRTSSSESAWRSASPRLGEPDAAVWRRWSTEPLSAIRLEQSANSACRLRAPVDHPIGDFFGADFEQERKAHWATSAALLRAPARRARCWSTQHCATPSASLRTRPITPTRSVTLIAPRASSRLNRCEHFSTCS